MTQLWCPSCHQFFGEPGFCPYDGHPLAPPPDGVATAPVRAVSAHDADVAAALAMFPGEGAALYARLVGQTLDNRYYIERKIGEGGMGVVYAARHLVIERPLAIKVLKREVARDASTIKRFVQEAKAASRIGHPNIVDVTDFGSTPEGMTYQVMEYVEGTTLSQAIKQSAPFGLARALPIAAQIAQALGAAHDKGIVHRDLKPENIFLINRDGRRDFVKIVDFGIAKVSPIDSSAPSDGPRLTRAGAVFGTPEYMAPEQAAGRNDTDGRVDVYALGTILYEMFTGRVPHKSDNMMRTLAMQMLDPIEPPSKVRPDAPLDPEVEGIVMHALAKKREQRFQTMGELHEAIRAAAAARAIDLTQPVSTSVTAGRPALQLQPLPPGASGRAADQPTLRDGSPSSPPPVSKPPPPLAPVTAADGDLDRPTRRVANEPAFVASPSRLTFELDDDAAPPAVATRPRWPLAVAAIALFGGVGVGAALLLRGDDVVTRAPADAAVAELPGPVDAGRVVELVADAGEPVIVEVAADAGVDAGRTAGVRPGRDAGPAVAAIDGGIGYTPEARGAVSIEVITRPDGGILYVNQSYRGPSGTHLEEPKGSRATVTCTLPGYEPGKIELVFDGKTEVVVCSMQRIARCVPGIKNPFDDCPD